MRLGGLRQQVFLKILYFVKSYIAAAFKLKIDLWGLTETDSKKRFLSSILSYEVYIIVVIVFNICFVMETK